jgi:hypothetical protein
MAVRWRERAGDSMPAFLTTTCGPGATRACSRVHGARMATTRDSKRQLDLGRGEGLARSRADAPGQVRSSENRVVHRALRSARYASQAPSSIPSRPSSKVRSYDSITTLLPGAAWCRGRAAAKARGGSGFATSRTSCRCTCRASTERACAARCRRAGRANSGTFSFAPGRDPAQTAAGAKFEVLRGLHAPRQSGKASAVRVVADSRSPSPRSGPRPVALVQSLLILQSVS